MAGPMLSEVWLLAMLDEVRDSNPVLTDSGRGGYERAVGDIEQRVRWAAKALGRHAALGHTAETFAGQSVLVIHGDPPAADSTADAEYWG